MVVILNADVWCVHFINLSFRSRTMKPHHQQVSSCSSVAWLDHCLLCFKLHSSFLSTCQTPSLLNLGWVSWRWEASSSTQNTLKFKANSWGVRACLNSQNKHLITFTNDNCLFWKLVNVRVGLMNHAILWNFWAHALITWSQQTAHNNIVEFTRLNSKQTHVWLNLQQHPWRILHLSPQINTHLNSQLTQLIACTGGSHDVLRLHYACPCHAFLLSGCSDAFHRVHAIQGEWLKVIQEMPFLKYECINLSYGITTTNCMLRNQLLITNSRCVHSHCSKLYILIMNPVCFI